MGVPGLMQEHAWRRRIERLEITALLQVHVEADRRDRRKAGFDAHGMVADHQRRLILVAPEFLT
jgi:hypothetical protein